MATGYVRPARDTDVDSITRVQLATWRTAYPRFIPRFAIDEVPAEFVAERWRDAVRKPPTERHRVLVAVEQAADRPEVVVGFVAAGPADETVLTPGESTPAPDLAAITDLLVEPRWGRRGHGSRLLAATVELWRADGFTSAVAWAFEQDTATVKFLTATGWQPDGASRGLDIDGVIVPQIRLHVALDTDDPGNHPGADRPTP
jgi:GNAT superfamily N-acetyltransferase